MEVRLEISHSTTRMNADSQTKKYGKRITQNKFSILETLSYISAKLFFRSLNFCDMLAIHFSVLYRFNNYLHQIIKYNL